MILPPAALALANGQQRAQCVVVVGPRCNSFVEDGGIAGDTVWAIVFHQSLELTARDQITTNVIQPAGLAKVLELS